MHRTPTLSLKANVTVPLRAHAAHYHTSEAVSGWTHAAPASIAEATKQAARTAEATTLWGYRTAYKVCAPTCCCPANLSPGYTKK